MSPERRPTRSPGPSPRSPRHFRDRIRPRLRWQRNGVDARDPSPLATATGKRTAVASISSCHCNIPPRGTAAQLKRHGTPMAEQPRVRERPLSPHLQVYSWQVQMVTSILHRATGVVLSLGSLLLVCAFLSLAAGPQEWARFSEFARSGLGFLILFGWSWSLAFHLINGIRHLIQDAGYAYAIEAFVRSSWISVFGSLLLTALIWVLAMMQRGAA